jgi:hypothetical protein
MSINYQFFIILFYFGVVEIKELLDPRVSWKNHEWISSFDWWMFSKFWEPRSVPSTKAGSVVYQDWVFDFVENLQLLNSKNRLNILPFGGSIPMSIGSWFQKEPLISVLTLFFHFFIGNFGLDLRLNFLNF